MTARPEEALQRAVVGFLATVLPDHAVWWATANQRGTRSRCEMGVLKAMGVRAGVPDLFVLHEGHLIGLELKAARGRLSPSQNTMLGALVCAGAVVAVCRSVDDVAAALANAGVPLKGRLSA